MNLFNVIFKYFVQSILHILLISEVIIIICFFLFLHPATWIVVIFEFEFPVSYVLIAFLSLLFLHSKIFDSFIFHPLYELKNTILDGLKNTIIKLENEQRHEEFQKRVLDKRIIQGNQEEKTKRKNLLQDFIVTKDNDFVNIPSDKNEVIDEIDYDSTPTFREKSKERRIPNDNNRNRSNKKIRKIDFPTINKFKGEIGLAGEILVYEYEKVKLQNKFQSKEERDKILIHRSVVEGDGHGFDITSWKEGKIISIEVKTTIGKFEERVFFTQNELNVMEEKGEDYYLYRVFNLDLMNETADLIIIKGKEAIHNTFNFEPVSFKGKAINQSEIEIPVFSLSYD